MPNSDFRLKFYENYSSFKGWDDDSIDYSEIFAHEINRAQLPRSAKILEVGFGGGRFLEWATSQQHEVFGIEVSKDLVDSAAKKGFKVFHTALQNIEALNISSASLDAVVLFDVLEHLYPDEILDFFKKIKVFLKPEGKIIARFPNCASPFGYQLQYADMTHVTELSEERIRQVAMITGYKVYFAGNAARPLTIGHRPMWQRKLLFKMRNIFEVIVGLLYFGRKFPLDPNMLIVLQKQ